MTLPPKALTVLATIRAELLSAAANGDDPAAPRVEEDRLAGEPKRITARNGHAHHSGDAFQRGCRRRAFWAPTH